MSYIIMGQFHTRSRGVSFGRLIFQKGILFGQIMLQDYVVVITKSKLNRGVFIEGLIFLPIVRRGE